MGPGAKVQRYKGLGEMDLPNLKKPQWTLLRDYVKG